MRISGCRDGGTAPDPCSAGHLVLDLLTLMFSQVQRYSRKDTQQMICNCMHSFRLQKKHLNTHLAAICGNLILLTLNCQQLLVCGPASVHLLVALEQTIESKYLKQVQVIISTSSRTPAHTDKLTLDFWIEKVNI